MNTSATAGTSAQDNKTAVRISPRQKELLNRSKIPKIEKETLKEELDDNLEDFSGYDPYDNAYDRNY